jgi:D-glucosaminate-specific PTS system IIC component
MENTLVLALFTGFWYWLGQSKLGYTFHWWICQPIVMALPIGLILGDVGTAMIIGASIELVYMGMVAAGSNLPADECLAGLIAIPIALQTGMDPQMAVTFAIPFGVLGVFVDQARRTINAGFAHMADKHAEGANFKGIYFCAFVWPILIGFVLRFPPVFIANYYGASAVESFLNVIPAWVLHGLSVAGGILPALGFAIIIFIIGKAKLLPFFIIGFFLVQYLQLNIMAAAIFGTCTALLIILFKNINGDNNRGEIL